MKLTYPIALIILDGFGYSKTKEYNAIHHARMPIMNSWFRQYPHTLLQAAGDAVGLLPGYMGNSEVGHLTIGSGRIIDQPVKQIHTAIADKSFYSHQQLLDCLTRIKKNDGVLHIMGLLSDAGVHSDIEHLYALLDIAYQQKIPYVFIHAFLDGRDTVPQAAESYLAPLEKALTAFQYGSIGSIHGRFYAMDRDKNWDRTKKSYDVLIHGENCAAASWKSVLQAQYKSGLTDEFVIPTQLDPTSRIEDNDGIVFINFRADRARQLTESLLSKQFVHFTTKQINLSCFATMTQYEKDLNTTVLFPKSKIYNTLKDVLSADKKTIFSIAETEKYAHISYFFTGNREKPVQYETRTLIPSLKEKNYISHPEMSALDITNAVIKSLTPNPYDFYLINYANADMVGHSGNFDATVHALEILDTELKKLYDTFITQNNGTLIITGDHGNAEKMFLAKENQEYTAHTINPVPFIAINQKLLKSQTPLPLTTLADIAPFILKSLELPIPDEMQLKNNL